MPFDISQPAIRLLPVIIVTWHDQTRRYARSHSDVTIGGNIYSAIPELEIEFKEQGGGTEDAPVRITIPTSLDPFWKMVASQHARVTVTIAEASLSDLAAGLTLMYVGQVARTIARPGGKSRLMEIELWGRKAFLVNVSLGIKATDRCPLRFGDHVCGATIATVTGIISAIAGKLVTFSTLPADTTKHPWLAGRYTRGYIEKDGLRITVHEHKVGQKKLVLVKAPPQVTGYTWVGQSVTVAEGCDKSTDACIAHGRASSYLGIGKKMPKYNPIIEEAP